MKFTQSMGRGKSLRRDSDQQSRLFDETMQLSSYPSRKQRRPQKRRQFGWLQIIVALFICVILLTTLGLGGYLSDEAGDKDSKYDELPASTEDRSSSADSDSKADEQESDTPDEGTTTDTTEDEGTTDSTDSTGNEQTPTGDSQNQDGNEPTPSVDQEKVHIVKKGETLYSISMAYYGHAKYIDNIIAANKLSDANHVEAGMKLNIPPVQ